MHAGKLQKGAESELAASTKTDEHGNVLSRELAYSLLSDFEPRPQCVELVKPGDIDMPEADRQMDADNGRSDIRDALKDAHVVIKTNMV